jgi:opacity protein-like surface antigen
MKRWLTLSLVLGGLLFGFGTAVADDGDEDSAQGFGIGIGLVNLDEEEIADDVELYYMASYRFPVGGDDTHGQWRGLLEPEVGYFDADFTSDLLAGLNFVGVMPYGGVDFFVGAGLGVHFIDADVQIAGSDVRVSKSQEAFGVNAQFGVDVHLSDAVALFGAGRFDLVEDADALQAKAYVGLRFGS